MNTNPMIGVIHTIFLFITGRVRFFKGSVGKEMIMEDGKKFKVFRHVIIRPWKETAERPEAVFIIRFQPANMSVKGNIRFSLIPMIIFMGFRGFCSKYWMVDETTGLCQGIYEWKTMQDAENYSKSIAVTFMTKRSVPGTVEFKIIPNRDK